MVEIEGVRDQNTPAVVDARIERENRRQLGLHAANHAIREGWVRAPRDCGPDLREVLDMLGLTRPPERLPPKPKGGRRRKTEDEEL